MDDELITQTQKPFKFYINDLKNKQPQEDKNSHILFIKGFPYDEGAIRNGMRAGLDRGPSFFNYELKNSGHYPFSNIERIQIYDSGDIEHSFIDASIPLEKAYDLLEESEINFLKIQNSVFFAVGGSQDMTLPLFKGLYKTSSNKNLGIINIDARFDILLSDQVKVNSGSYFNEIFNDQNYSQSLKKFISFGSQGSQCTKLNYDFLIKNGADIYWLDKHIRKQKVVGESKLKTQAGNLMLKLLESIKEQNIVESLLFTFDISSINSNVCPGVSYPSVVGGLSLDEAKEICFLAGSFPIVRVFTLSEFNPAVETTKTSKLCVDLFYEFARGLSTR